MDYWSGFGKDGYDYTLYMVSWPVYKDESKRLEKPKEVKEQSYTGGGPGWEGYYFRVTKKQYEELTHEFFKADIISQWERVPVTYFVPEFERAYDSFWEFPYDMPYIGEAAFQTLENIYTEDFYVMFGVIETGSQEELYIVSLPCCEDKSANSEIPEEMIKYSYVSMEKGNYFYRVTKEQYEELTAEYFRADILSKKESVPLFYFLGEE